MAAGLLRIFVFSGLLVASYSSSRAFPVPIITVDQSGQGDYCRIQDAIDSVPVNNTGRVKIWVGPGVYRERVIIPRSKPFIVLIGSGEVEEGRTVVTGNLGGSILDSATVSVFASDFSGHNLTIENTYGPGSQAVALRVTGDRVSFYGCRILSYQDTLLDEAGRHFYKGCLIVGATDFICGNAASVFERCHLHSLSHGAGAITAQRRRSPAENTGFTFIYCLVTGEKSAILGRPWGNYSRVVFAFTYLSKAILPQGWDDWGKPSIHRTAFFGQYECFGPGANTAGRVAWSHSHLTRKEAEPFLSKDMIDGRTWVRSGEDPDPCE